MSENSKKTVSPSVGTEILADESRGGEKALHALENEEIGLGTACMPNADDPSMDDLQEVNVAIAKLGVKDIIKKIFPKGLITRICVFVASIVVFLLSFAPLVRYEINLGYGPIDTMSFSGMDSVLSVVVLLYRLIANLISSVFLHGAPVYQGPQIVADQITLMLLMGAALYLLYMVLCMTLIVLSIKNLIVELCTMKNGRNRHKNYASDSLACLLLCMLPAMVFCLMRAFRFYVSGIFMSVSGAFVGEGMAYGSVLLLVLLILLCIILCGSRLLGSPAFNRNRQNFDRRRVKHIFCALLVILSLLFSLFSCIEIRVEEPSLNHVDTVGISIWNFRLLSVPELAIYSRQGMINDAYVESAMADTHTGQILADSLMLSIPTIVIRIMYAVIEMILVLTFLSGGLLIFRLLKGAFFGTDTTKLISLFKSLTVIGSSINLVLVFILRYMMERYMRGSFSHYYIEIGIGMGIILSFAFVLWATVLRLKKKKIAYIDKAYDNPDISYAPYVLRVKRKRY